MLRDLRRALSEAILESSEVSRTLRKIREEGYSLYLLVDCKREANELEDRARQRRRTHVPDRRTRSFLPEVDRHRSHTPPAPPAQQQQRQQ